MTNKGNVIVTHIIIAFACIVPQGPPSGIKLKQVKKLKNMVKAPKTILLVYLIIFFIFNQLTWDDP